MSKTTSAVKNKWIAKNYDRINLTIPKGEKERVQAHAAARGESVNGLIWRLISEEIDKGV